MKRFLTLIVTLLLFVIAVVLGLKNQQVINVNYLIAQSDMRLATLLAIIFMLGFTVAVVLAALFYLKLKIRNGLLHSKNKKLHKEVEQLRSAVTFEKD